MNLWTAKGLESQPHFGNTMGKSDQKQRSGMEALLWCSCGSCRHCLHCGDWLSNGAYTPSEPRDAPGPEVYAFYMNTGGGKKCVWGRNINLYFKLSILKLQQEPVVAESWQWRVPGGFWNISVFAKYTNDLQICKKTPMVFTLMFVLPPELDYRCDDTHTHKRYTLVYAY